MHHFQQEEKKADLTKWHDLRHHRLQSVKELRIGMVGKYVGLEDAYYSLNESLKIAGFYHHYKVSLVFIEAEDLTPENCDEYLHTLA